MLYSFGVSVPTDAITSYVDQTFQIMGMYVLPGGKGDAVGGTRTIRPFTIRPVPISLTPPLPLCSNEGSEISQAEFAKMEFLDRPILELDNIVSVQE